MTRPEQQDFGTDRLRPRRSVRRWRAAAALLVVVLVAVAIWWQTDGQQRRRAVAGLGDLGGVSRASTADRDPRRVLVRMDQDATAAQVAAVVRRASAVTDSEKFTTLDVTVVAGSATTQVDEQHVRLVDDAGALRRRISLLVALRGLATGSVDVAADGFVILRRTGNPSSPDTGSLDQVLATLRLLDAADVSMPEMLYGYGQLDIARVEVGPATLARALDELRPLLRAGLRPEFVRGDVVTLGLPDDVPPARAGTLLRSAAAQLGSVRSGGRPVLRVLRGEYPSRAGSDAVEVEVR